MNWRIIRAIARKDLLEVRYNRMAWMPMLLVPIIICGIIPALVILGPGLLNMEPDKMMDSQDLEAFMQIIPPALSEQVAQMSEHQMMIYFVLAFLFAPMFLILPIMTASIIGSDSFVGEKERKTMEALLYTPASDRELFVGKMLASVVASILVAWLTFLFYTLILNVLGGPIMGYVWFPTPSWWPLVLWVTPAVAVMGMLGAVVVSARVNTFMEAYQSTGLLVLPVLLLVIGQLGGIVYLSVEVVLVVGLVIWLIDAGLLWLGLKIFNRQALLSGKA